MNKALNDNNDKSSIEQKRHVNFICWIGKIASVILFLISIFCVIKGADNLFAIIGMLSLAMLLVLLLSRAIKKDGENKGEHIMIFP